MKNRPRNANKISKTNINYTKKNLKSKNCNKKKKPKIAKIKIFKKKQILLILKLTKFMKWINKTSKNFMILFQPIILK